jgi:polysaccharide biosynthesis/export protein
MKAWRLGVLVSAAVGAIGATGCSSVGGAFGFSPPAYKLTDSAKMVRSANPAPAAIPKETQKALHPAYVVEPGDTLLVQPADLDSPIRLPGDQPVLADGTIDLGRFGRPVVAGKTLPAIETEVTDIIRAAVKAEAEKAVAAKDPAALRDAPTGPVVVTVRLVGRASKVYYVIGEVNAPGVFPITGRETVLDGVFAAGNLTRKASTKNIILSRPTNPCGCRIVLPVCWDDITQLADPSTNYQLMPGDRIYVPSKGTLEDLPFCQRRHKDDCLPCNRPQSACPVPAAECPTTGCSTPNLTTDATLVPASPATPVPVAPVIPVAPVSLQLPNVLPVSAPR